MASYIQGLMSKPALALRRDKPQVLEHRHSAPTGGGPSEQDFNTVLPSPASSEASCQRSWTTESFAEHDTRSVSPSPWSRAFTRSARITPIDKAPAPPAALATSARLLQEMRDITNATAGCPWHLVPWLDSLEHADLARAEQQGLDVPADIGAVVLPLVLPDFEAAHKLLDKLRFPTEAAVSRLPVVVVVVHVAALQDADDLVLETQQQLLKAGADAVILKSMSAHDLRLAIKMAVAQVCAARRATQRAERDLAHQLAECMISLENKAAEASEAAAAAEKAQADEKTARETVCDVMTLFWHVAHSALKGFPQLDPSLPHKLCVGRQVGPLIMHKELGHGNFGIAYTAFNEETQDWEAVKVVEKTDLLQLIDVKDLQREIACLKTLHHENIVAFKGVLHGPNHVAIRMEHGGGCNLFCALCQVGGRIRAADAKRCQRQLASAVAHCHGRRIAHCDLKPENLSLSIGEHCTLKVLDFGCAMSTEKLASRLIGTMPFMAPEVQEASPERPFRPAGCDIWSSAVILLELLCGLGKMNQMLGWERGQEPSPRCTADLRVFFQQENALFLALEQNLGVVPDDLQGLLLRMFQVDPARRLQASEVLNSRWLQQDQGLGGVPQEAGRLSGQ